MTCGQMWEDGSKVKQRVFIPGVDTGPGRQGIRLPPALCFLIDDPQAVTVPITGPVRIREPYPSIAGKLAVTCGQRFEEGSKRKVSVLAPVEAASLPSMTRRR